jgi:hypothetical protein
MSLSLGNIRVGRGFGGLGMFAYFRRVPEKNTGTSREKKGNSHSKNRKTDFRIPHGGVDFLRKGKFQATNIFYGRNGEIYIFKKNT